MTKKIEVNGRQLEFKKNIGKALIGLEFTEIPQECFLIDIFSVDSQDYIALVPMDSEELYIFRYDSSEDDEENISLLAIEDEKELDEVYDLFFHYWDEASIDQVVKEYLEDLEDLDLEEE